MTARSRGRFESDREISHGHCLNARTRVGITNTAAGPREDATQEVVRGVIRRSPSGVCSGVLGIGGSALYPRRFQIFCFVLAGNIQGELQVRDVELIRSNFSPKLSIGCLVIDNLA